MTHLFQDGKVPLLPWLCQEGPEATIVISTRARLARNLQAFPFPGHASEVELATVLGEVRRNMPPLEELACLDGQFLDLPNLPPVQGRCLQELRLTSPGFWSRIKGRGLLLASDLSCSIMINEEDHLRLQAYEAGFAPHSALEQVVRMDRALETSFSFACDEELGYLTACPTNVGTGFRLTALLHLPGLVMIGEIDKVLNALRQLRLSVRGLFGEGSSVRGALFQLGNMQSLGRSEDDLVQDLEHHLNKVVSYEKMARMQLHERDHLGVSDRVRRSLAILQSARLLTAQEAFDRLSDVRLGSDLGILPHISVRTLNKALIGHQAAHLELAAGCPLAGRERSAARADFLANLLN